MKSNSSIPVLMCALLMTAGTLDVLRAVAQSSEAAAPGGSQQETTKDNNQAPGVFQEVGRYPGQPQTVISGKSRCRLNRMEAS